MTRQVGSFPVFNLDDVVATFTHFAFRAKMFEHPPVVLHHFISSIFYGMFPGSSHRQALTCVFYSGEASNYDVTLLVMCAELFFRSRGRPT